MNDPLVVGYTLPPVDPSDNSPYQQGYRVGFMDGEKQGFARGLEEGRKIGEQIGQHKADVASVKTPKRRALVNPRGPYSPQFEEFWKAYPADMRGTKLEAWQAWAKLAPNELLFDEMLAALKAQVLAYEAHAAGNGPFFARLKHACRWIKYQGWDMDVPRQAEQKRQGPNRPELA